MKKTEKNKRRAILMRYLRKHRHLADAKSAAKADGIVANTSAWINAYGKVLEEQSPSQPASESERDAK